MAKANDSPLRFHVHLNKGKTPTNREPLLTGGLLPPGAEKERRVRLWAHYTGRENGKLPGVISGSISKGLSAEDQFVAHTQGEAENDTTYAMEMKGDRDPMTIKPGEIVFFLSPNRDESKKQPHYFGYANPGGGEKLLSIGGWVSTDRNDDMQITGDVQLYEKRMEQRQADGPARDGHDRESEEPEREDEMSM